MFAQRGGRQLTIGISQAALAGTRISYSPAVAGRPPKSPYPFVKSPLKSPLRSPYLQVPDSPASPRRNYATAVNEPPKRLSLRPASPGRAAAAAAASGVPPMNLALPRSSRGGVSARRTTFDRTPVPVATPTITIDTVLEEGERAATAAGDMEPWYMYLERFTLDDGEALESNASTLVGSSSGAVPAAHEAAARDMLDETSPRTSPDPQQGGASWDSWRHRGDIYPAFRHDVAVAVQQYLISAGRVTAAETARDIFDMYKRFLAPSEPLLRPVRRRGLDALLGGQPGVFELLSELMKRSPEEDPARDKIVELGVALRGVVQTVQLDEFRIRLWLDTGLRYTVRRDAWRAHKDAIDGSDHPRNKLGKGQIAKWVDFHSVVGHMVTEGGMSWEDPFGDGPGSERWTGYDEHRTLRVTN